MKSGNVKKSIVEKCLTLSTGELLKWLVGNFPVAKAAMKACVLSIVEKEAQHICKKSFPSQFKFRGFEPLIDYDVLKMELVKITPWIHDIIFQIGVNRISIKKSKSKTEESMFPACVNAVGSLLYARNKYMSRCALSNAFILKRGKADKMSITRMNHLKMSTSFDFLHRKQIEMGKNFLEPVQEWIDMLTGAKDPMTKEFVKSPIELMKCDTGAEIYSDDLECSFFDEHGTSMEVLEKSFGEFNIDDLTFDDEPLLEVTRCNKPAEVNFELPIIKLIWEFKFIIVGDNLDKMIRRRNMLISRQNTDLHMFNMIAVLDRVFPRKEILDIPANPPKCKSDINLHDYLPDSADEKLLVSELEILVARDVLKYMKDINSGWADDLFPKVIKHDYMDATSKKSEVVRVYCFKFII